MSCYGGYCEVYHIPIGPVRDAVLWSDKLEALSLILCTDSCPQPSKKDYFFLKYSVGENKRNLGFT